MMPAFRWLGNGMRPAGKVKAATGHPQQLALCVVRKVLSALRGYWSAALLGLAALVLLVLGAPAKAALAGAGFAFIGAAVTRGIDLAKERRAEAALAAANRRRDLDETRRVAYMALVSGGTERYELVATIVNALAYHGLAVDPEVAAGHVQNLVSGMPVNPAESRRWLQEQIDQITAELSSHARATRPSQPLP